MIYVGDGSNDFCPIMKFRRYRPLRWTAETMTNLLFRRDMVFCRRFRGLEHRIKHEGESQGLLCQVKYWAGAWEVEELFGQLPDAVEMN